MENVLKKVDELREYYVKLLKDMVSIATVVPPGENYKEFVNYGKEVLKELGMDVNCLLYTSPSPRDISGSRMPSSA